MDCCDRADSVCPVASSFAISELGPHAATRETKTNGNVVRLRKVMALSLHPIDLVSRLDTPSQSPALTNARTGPSGMPRCWTRTSTPGKFSFGWPKPERIGKLPIPQCWRRVNDEDLRAFERALRFNCEGGSLSWNPNRSVTRERPGSSRRAV